MSWSLLWNVCFFVAFAFLPITLPLMLILGCPSYGHVIVLYFLVASLPSALLAVGEGFVDPVGSKAWEEMIASWTQGIYESVPGVVTFRPHVWGKWFALALAVVGALLTVAGMVMYPQEFLKFIFSNPEGSRRGYFIVGLLVAVCGGPAVGGFIGYTYGIHLGAIVDIGLRVAGRTKATAQCSDIPNLDR